MRIGSCDLLAFFIINSASSLQSGNINSEAEMRNWNSWRCNTVAFLSGPPVNTCTEKGWRLQATQQGTTAIQLSSASTTTTVHILKLKPLLFPPFQKQPLKANHAIWPLKDLREKYSSADRYFLSLGGGIVVNYQKAWCQSIIKD